MTAAWITERADCSEVSARSRLSFSADLGTAIRHESRPLRDVRTVDDSEWRRVNELMRENAVEKLRARVSELTDRIEPSREEYGTDSPAGVDVPEFDAERVDDASVDLGD